MAESKSLRLAGNGAVSADNQQGFDLCEQLWKRRNGLGKHADNNWVPRCFTFHGSVLCYYECEDFEDADPSRPRGRIDLIRDETKASYVDEKKPGAPTQYLIVLQIFVLGGIERKWKMCANSKSQQQRWYEALKQFDGQPTVDVGQQILEALNIGPNTPKGPSRRVSSAGKFVHKLRKTSSAFTFPEDVMLKGQEHKVETLPMTAEVLFFSLNLLLVFARAGNNDVFWGAVILANLCLYQGIKLKGKEKKKIIDEDGSEPGFDFEEGLSDSKTLHPAGSTIPRAKAKPGSDLEKFLSQPNQGPMTVAGTREIARNLHSYEKIPHSYWNGDASVFRVRMGPNYKRTGRKEPSNPALYDLYAVDLIRTEETVRESRDVFTPPVIPGITDTPTGHPYIPPMMIVNCVMPSNEPSMLSPTTDGPSFDVIFYFVISEDTRRQIQDMSSATPAVQLFGDWCRRAENEPNFRGRFKCMCVLDDIEKLDLPALPVPGGIQKYNGKPVLINKSGAFYRRENYIEHRVNVHLFGFIPKKCLYTIQPKFPKMVLNVGFTIEGKDDDEAGATECIFGCGKFFHMDPGAAPDDLGVD
mmetsp:Transcript_11022/g.21959  ORF Transcript_11022/g.21959 Transcript_11022/m.21959 type:complete len:584 (+) Transcript_11022:225-1976(+)